MSKNKPDNLTQELQRILRNPGEDGSRCQYEARVAGGGFCKSPATVVHDGRLYCRVHNPERDLAKERDNPNRGRVVRPSVTLRLTPDAYHKARIAAMVERTTVGKWLEDAINQRAKKTEKMLKDWPGAG